MTVGDQGWTRYDLGCFDPKQKTLQPSTTCSARGCHPCLGYELFPMYPGWTNEALVRHSEQNYELVYY